jgi:hypothetical protein
VGRIECADSLPIWPQKLKTVRNTRNATRVDGGRDHEAGAGGKGDRPLIGAIQQVQDTSDWKR